MKKVDYFKFHCELKMQGIFLDISEMFISDFSRKREFNLISKKIVL